jgi:dienelactone hydrolase
MLTEIKVVVAYASGSLVGTGIDSTHSGTVSSWTYQGKPLPFARCKATTEFTSQFGRNEPLRLLPLNGPCLHDAEAIKGALIPVEKIKGAVLLITGGDDQTGPSSESAEMMMGILKKQNHEKPFMHLSYPSAGHAIYSFYAPTTLSTTAGRLALGGTPEANARAQADSWPKVLGFLKMTL